MWQAGINPWSTCNTAQCVWIIYTQFKVKLCTKRNDSFYIFSVNSQQRSKTAYLPMIPSNPHLMCNSKQINIFTKRCDAGGGDVSSNPPAVFYMIIQVCSVDFILKNTIMLKTNRKDFIQVFSLLFASDRLIQCVWWTVPQTQGGSTPTHCGSAL